MRSQYELSSTGGTVVALIIGAGLLGSGGDQHCQWYPYDFTHACVFALCFVAILTRSVWFAPAFIVACYAKETAVLLLAAYIVIDNGRSLGWKLAFAAVLGAAYLAIQVTIDRW